ncbi:hypothetical protein [Janthinobacterium sp. UMAB-56]|uniref:hypothetical protein n=1 Tax=Janthinobacterium sp. UMAB-56 TaxID=1365361 RepID=UPI001C597F4D|nr:hypothetical protein [Janthinobacterium sp. UMAB-56]
MRTQPPWRARLLSNGSVRQRQNRCDLEIFYGEIKAPHKDGAAYWRVRLICATLVFVGPLRAFHGTGHVAE